MRGVHGGGASIVVVGSGKSGTAARRRLGAPGSGCWEGLLGGGGCREGLLGGVRAAARAAVWVQPVWVRSAGWVAAFLQGGA